MGKLKWRKTTKHRPKLRRDVIGWYSGGVGYIVVQRDYDGHYYDDTGGKWRPPDYWVKLPRSPETK